MRTKGLAAADDDGDAPPPARPPARTTTPSYGLGGNATSISESTIATADIPAPPALRSAQQAPAIASLSSSVVPRTSTATTSTSTGNGNGEMTSNQFQVKAYMASLGTQDNINVERLPPGAVSVHGVNSQELGSPQSSNQNNRSQWDNVAEPSDRDEEDPLEANVSLDSLQIVAELAPDEADVEARLAERLERQWNDRLKQEVEAQLSTHRQAHVIAEAVTLPNSSDGQDGPNATSMSGAPVDDNFKVCGLRRRTWGFLLLIVLILVGGGIAGGVIYLQSQGDGDGDNNNSSNSGSTNPPSLRPTLPPTDASNENMEYLLEQLRDRIAPTNADFAKLEDAATPQFQALAWLANEDQYVRFPETVATTELLERYVLAVLYFSTDGPNWLYEFLEPRTACQWNLDNTFGVFCERVSNRDSVTYLEMYDLGMTGTIPWELSLLENLTTVDLSDNRLSGPIPSEFSDFTNLSIMWLDGNFLTGQLPNDLPSSMEHLVLGRNLFTGTLPGNWGEGLPDLTDLSLRVNQIEGTLPPSWGNMGNLVYLDFEENWISGSIPSEYGSLGNLESLFLELNFLTGSLPTELGQLDLLTQFIVYGNLELMGTIPTEFMLLRNLVFFQFEDTSLTGSVDETLCALSVPPAEMRGDCLGFAPEIQCSCCTFCCTQNGETCELMVV